MNTAIHSECELFSPQRRGEKDLQREHTADLAQVICEHTVNPNVRQATMAAVARISEFNLLDFLQ